MGHIDPGTHRHDPRKTVQIKAAVRGLVLQLAFVGHSADAHTSFLHIGVISIGLMVYNGNAFFTQVDLCKYSYSEN